MKVYYASPVGRGGNMDNGFWLVELYNGQSVPYGFKFTEKTPTTIVLKWLSDSRKAMRQDEDFLRKQRQQAAIKLQGASKAMQNAMKENRLQYKAMAMYSSDGLAR